MVRLRFCVDHGPLCLDWDGLALSAKRIILITIDWSIIRKRGCILRGIVSCQVSQVHGSRICGPTSPFDHRWCCGGFESGSVGSGRRGYAIDEAETMCYGT